MSLMNQKSNLIRRSKDAAEVGKPLQDNIVDESVILCTKSPKKKKSQSQLSLCLSRNVERWELDVINNPPQKSPKRKVGDGDACSDFYNFAFNTGKRNQTEFEVRQNETSWFPTQAPWAQH